MKTIKSELYKEYQIVVRAKYSEGSTKFVYASENFESIVLALSVVGSGISHYETESIEENKKRRNELYKSMNKQTEALVTKAKEMIDKKIREEEMTYGLPESLMEEVDNSVLVSDRYKTAIDDLNKYIKKQQEMQDKYPLFSKEYEQHLRNEISLQKDKMDILKKREKELSELIKNKTFTGNWAGIGIGKVATLHPNELILNKEDTEKILQSASESAILLGNSISEVLDSYVEFAKQGYKEDGEDGEVPDIFDSVYTVCIQAIKDTDEKKATELTASLLKALNRDKNLE